MTAFVYFAITHIFFPSKGVFEISEKAYAEWEFGLHGQGNLQHILGFTYENFLAFLNPSKNMEGTDLGEGNGKNINK